MPFYRGAFETVTAAGTVPASDTLPSNSGFVVGWGNYYEPAGYYPGRASRGADRTGLLVDETSWSYDVSQILVKLFLGNIQQARSSYPNPPQSQN